MSANKPYDNTMLGRIARAAHSRLYPNEPHPMAECIDIARAAVEAMREPTAAMIKAGNATGMFICGDEDVHESDREPKGVWQAMIDDVLKARR